MIRIFMRLASSAALHIVRLMVCILTLTVAVDANALECPIQVKKLITFEGKIDLNRATEADLSEIHRVGVKTARAIVDHRKMIGGFKSMDQLLRVRGVGDKTMACLQKHAHVLAMPSPAKPGPTADANRKR